ncbi:MAG TPA: type II toxin-antitoxin system VapC family toxin, partial [Beijerinckiaceae bacterium]|nr:type II toxin-antitoxin system VapC family toxin [Beijerinckiaceae bacterium]
MSAAAAARPPVRERFRAALESGERIALPSVVLFELSYGAAKSERRTANTERIAVFLGAGLSVLPFEAEDAEMAGALRADLERAGTPIGPFDLLIAAQARRHRATLVTANRREFARIPDLEIVDWSEP